MKKPIYLIFALAVFISGLLLTGTTANAQYISSTLEQVSAAVIFPNTTNQPIVRIRINTGPNPMQVYGLFFGTDSSTNTSADLASAKVFYTDSSTVFSTMIQYGNTVAAPIGTGITIFNTMSIVEGTNYFWLVYDLTPSAIACDTLDASCYTIYLSDGTHTPLITNPAGYAVMAPCATGINIPDFENPEYFIYPNPSNDFVTIKLKNIVADEITISLTDLSGRKIKQWNLINTENDIQLPLNDIVPGCYFINVNFQNKLFTQKIIKL